MSDLSNHAEDNFLSWAFTTDSVTRPTAWYVELHVGDPGEDGDQNPVLAGTHDGDYVRKAVTFSSVVADSGQILSAAQVSWTAKADAINHTYTHVSIHDALTSGNCWAKGELLTPHDQVAAGVFTLAAGKILVALD